MPHSAVALTCIFVPLAIQVTLGAGAQSSVLPVTDDLTLVTSNDGSYRVEVSNVTWFQSADTFFRADGHLYSIRHGSLKKVTSSEYTGRDLLGQWWSLSTTWKAGRVNIETTFKIYTEPRFPFIIFSQKYVNDTFGTTAVDKDFVIGSFPAFQMAPASVPLGYMAYGGMMFGDTGKSFGRWGETLKAIPSGIDGGPLAVFDEHGKVVVISPASQFMAASNWRESLPGVHGTIHWGIMGMVDRVPAEYQMDFILYYGSRGINEAFEGWGEVLRTMYGRDDTLVREDITINYIGYWTDNGAYYYYHTEPNKTYEQTVLDVVSYIKESKIPFRYIQYDSWWYYKGVMNGVKNWTAMPEVFPHGMQYLQNQINLPISAHNRYWASDTTYAKQNGGNYTFIIGIEKAVPVDQQFWIDLLKEGTTWGLVTYEQDWLNDEFHGLVALLSNLTLGRTWLMQMGLGAKVNGLTIQYCMSNSRHALQTLEIPQVTQARVSDDYHPGREQWRIGESSLFAHALRVAPYKDTFWTTSIQPGNPYGLEEPYTGLEAAVSTLSTGPIGPSDMIGAVNVSLLMRSCNIEGLILKPSKPATAIDIQIQLKAFGKLPYVWGTTEIWSTFSNVSGFQFGIVLAADVSFDAITLGPYDVGFTQQQRKIFHYQSPEKLADFNDMSPLDITANCTKANFCLFHSPPVIQLSSGSEVILLGELSKWVPVSPQRVAGIQVTDDVVVTLKGASGETVNFVVSKDNNLREISCTLGTDGAAQLSVNGLSCS